VAGVAFSAFFAWGTLRQGRRLLSCWPFVIIIVGAFAIIGVPELQFGYNWISFANNDMVNYANGADRFLRYGFYHAPAMSEIATRTNPTVDDFYRIVIIAERSGAELMLALFTSITSLRPLQTFMPYIVAIHLAIVMAAMGLVYRTESRRAAAALTGIFLSCSGS
jgi:uncharacterized protein YacL